MKVIFGFIWYFVFCAVASIITFKRGRSGMLVLFMCVAGGTAMSVFTITVSVSSGGTNGFLVFLLPVFGLLWASTARSSEQLAVDNGEHGKFRKCPFCAESVRKEAVKCRHCNSDLVAYEPADKPLIIQVKNHSTKKRKEVCEYCKFDIDVCGCKARWS